MAGELTTTTTANDIYFASWVGSSILDEARPNMPSKGLMNFEGRKPTKAFDFPIQDDPGAGGAWSEPADQATSQTVNPGLTTSKATATAQMYGFAAVVTDFIDAIAVVDAVSHFSQVVGRSVAEEVEIVTAAQYANYSNVTTASTVALLDDFHKALGALEARDARGEIVAVLSPKQLSDLRRDLLGTVAASFYGSPQGAATVGDIANTDTSGTPGNIDGIKVYTTTALSQAAGNDQGGLFVKGVTNGFYEVWDMRTESHRDALKPGTQLVCSVNFGVAEIRDAWGQALFSDS